MKQQLIIASALLLLGSCNLYKKFEAPQFNENEQSGLLRDTAITDTSCMASLKWQEMFTDPHLQSLIERGLKQNYNLKASLLRIEQAQALLSSSKAAFWPSLNFAPDGTIASFNGNTSKIYDIPLVADWQIPLFGGVLNNKRAAKANVEMAKASRQAVQAQLVASIANGYYTLLMLDKEVEVTQSTVKLWNESISTMRDLKTIGRANEASVAQSEANCLNIQISVNDLQQQIKTVENSLSVLIGDTPHSIERGSFADSKLPTQVQVGVPLQILANRPDVALAQQSLASAYYATNVARSAFYPNITLSGTLGWTNHAGDYIVNPGKLIESATAALLWPIWNRGVNKANLKLARTQQEIAGLAFRQTVLNAGSEVCNALSSFNTAQKKETQRKLQIEALQKSVDYTRELFRLGTTSYLEVLTAQEGLLNAQLADVSDHYQQMQAVISLYQALGGGKE
jgi:multidrug efflux system outer membrane protein